MNNEGQIKGIERNVPRAVAEEISAWEILNLRPVRGGWRPVGRKPIEITGITGLALHMHVMDTVRNLISIQNSTLFFKNIENGITKTIVGRQNESQIEGEILDINHLGKILIVSTTAKKYEFIYSNRLSVYLSTVYPSLATPIKQEKWSDTQSGSSHVHGDNKAELEASFNEAKEKMQAEGATEGWMFVRMAVELVDGTFIRPTYPTLIYLGDQSMIANIQTGLSDAYTYSIWDFEFHRLFVNSTDFMNWANYYGMSNPTIAGIAIFGTAPVSAYDIATQPATAGYMNKSDKMVSQIFNSQQTFWLLGRISIGELASGNKKLIIPNYNTLETGAILDIEDSGLNSITHRTSFVYNGRLITGNISTAFGTGYFGSTDVSPLIEFEIETELGDLIVRGSLGNSVPWIIAYPDTRAKKVNIYYRDGSDWKRAFSKGLSTSDNNNLAYCWYHDISALAWNNDHGHMSGYLTASTNLETNPATDPVVTLRDVNNKTSDPNRVQASEINNPLVMPYKNSYQVGNSSILGFSANGSPVSEGQFGQYPLYTFTGEGIYMMEVGVDPFISSVRQINGEVCNSPKTIKNIGVGVLFTTDKGLIIINGIETNALSVNFEQELHNDYAILHNSLYQKAIGLTELGQPDRFISTKPFIDYLIGANIGFDYPNREIWVNNQAYPYSYVFAIDYQSWSKRDETFTTIVDDYPRYYAQQSDRCKNLSAKESTQNINVFLLSNPVKIQLDSFKQFRRMVARGEFPAERMGIYLFGSIDGFSWAYVGGKEIVSSEPITPTQFEHVVETGAFQKTILGGDGRIYFVGAYGTGGIHRIDHDGQIRLVVDTPSVIHDKIVRDIAGRIYIMVTARGVLRIDTDGSVQWAYTDSFVEFKDAVVRDDGQVQFICALTGVGDAFGGILTSHDDGHVALVMNTVGMRFNSAFKWKGHIYYIGDTALWYEYGNPVQTGVNVKVKSYAEGLDGKLYIAPDEMDKPVFVIDEYNNVTQKYPPLSDFVRNITIISSIDGKIFFRIFHGDVGEQTYYDVYRIDESGDLVHVLNKSLTKSAKGQDGKIYLYGVGGVYRFDSDNVLRDTGINENFDSSFLFDGKLYFSDGINGKVWVLDTDGVIKPVVVTPNGFSKILQTSKRIYFQTENDGIRYLDSNGNLGSLNIPQDVTLGEINEVNGNSFLLSNGHGIYRIEGDDVLPTNVSEGLFRLFAIEFNGKAYFAAVGGQNLTAYYPVMGIFSIDRDTANIVKAKDAIYLGVHKSVKYATLVIEGIVTHEWNLTHISETAESTTNKKLR
jgi:hypothetical protein